MQFRDWRKMKGLTLEQCAETLPFRFGTIQRHETGVRAVDLETAEKYRIFTGGEVTFDDWLALGKIVDARRAGEAPEKSDESVPA